LPGRQLDVEPCRENKIAEIPEKRIQQAEQHKHRDGRDSELYQAVLGGAHTRSIAQGQKKAGACSPRSGLDNIGTTLA
jgi:hypothetical protein